MRTWTRVGFREQEAYELAITKVAGLNASSHRVVARHQAADSSVWSVDGLNRAGVSVSWGQPMSAGLLSPEAEGCSYLYFSPGAAEALQHLLPDWVHDPCEPPPAHLAVPVFGADDDSHFGSY